MKKVNSMVDGIFKRAANVIIDHFKTPVNFIGFMASAADDIYGMEHRYTPNSEEKKERDGLHYFILDTLRTVSEPWINEKPEEIWLAVRGILNFDSAEGFYRNILLAHGAMILSYTQFGISKDQLISTCNDFRAMLEVALLLQEAESIEEHERQKEAA